MIFSIPLRYIAATCYLLLKCEYLVSPPIETQIKALLYQTMCEERITKTELAKRLQVN